MPDPMDEDEFRRRTLVHRERRHKIIRWTYLYALFAVALGLGTWYLYAFLLRPRGSVRPPTPYTR